MTISSARSIHGISCQGVLSRPLVEGTAQIGKAATAKTYPLANVAYALQATLSTIGNVLAVNFTTGATTGSTTWVAGAAQIETATVTAASGATSAGDLTLSLTSGVVTGASSGLAIVVPLTTASDTAAKVATALAAGLNANAAFATHYTATTSTVYVILTRKVDANGFYYATDASLNLAIPAALGITAAVSSVQTVAGTVTSGTHVFDGDGLDFEGITIPTIATLDALFVELLSGGTTADGPSTVVYPIPALFYDAPQSLLGATTFTATAANTSVRITVIGHTA